MPPRRSSGQPPQGSDPDGRDLGHEYADDEISEAPEWPDDDDDPLDGRPLPRRRRRRGVRIGRVLAWTGGAALLMVAGGVLALATWPRSPGPATTVAAAPAGPDVAAAPVPREGDDAVGTGVGGAGEEVSAEQRPDVLGPSGPAASPADTDTRISPPPLPRLPPGLEVDTSSATSSPAEAPAQPRRSSPPDASPPRPARSVAPPPAALPESESRRSEEIMADFLVSSGGRAQAEATARAYAEWYGPGTGERTYWLSVLRAVRNRP